MTYRLWAGELALWSRTKELGSRDSQGAFVCGLFSLDTFL